MKKGSPLGLPLEKFPSEFDRFYCRPSVKTTATAAGCRATSPFALEACFTAAVDPQIVGGLGTTIVDVTVSVAGVVVTVPAVFETTARY